MKKLIITSALICIALIICSCVNAQQAQIDTANISIEAAKTAGADRYAPETFNAASEALKTAVTAVEKQKAKFALFRNYDAAKAILASVVTLANKAIEETTTKKAALKVQVIQAVTDLDTLIRANKELLAKAPKGKEGKTALEAVGQEIAVIETESTTIAAGLANNEDILTLSERIKPAVEKAQAINTELTDVMARIKDGNKFADKTLQPKEEPRPEPIADIIYYESFNSDQSFPFPNVPEPSAEQKLTNLFSNIATKLKNVDSILVSALDENSYFRKSYLFVPAGFALVTQLERIDENGYSFPDPNRWRDPDQNSISRGFSLADYIKSLFKAKPGYYRCIVFLITPDNYTVSGQAPDRETPTSWLKNGLRKLPKEVGELDFTADYSVDALIYEFKKLENEDEAKIITPGSFSGNTHLVNSGILKSLTK